MDKRRARRKSVVCLHTVYSQTDMDYTHDGTSISKTMQQKGHMSNKETLTFQNNAELQLVSVSYNALGSLCMY